MSEKFQHITWRTFLNAIEYRVICEDQDPYKAYVDVKNILDEGDPQKVIIELQAATKPLTGPTKYPTRFITKEEEDLLKETYPQHFEAFINCKLKPAARRPMLAFIREKIKLNKVLGENNV